MTETPQPSHEEMLALAAALGRAGADEIAAHFHPLANVFPLMPDAERRELGESLAENGQREKIVLLDGLILDGRNRAIELRRRGLTIHLRHYDPKTDGEDPVRFIVDRNLRRRQLTDDQRRMVAARLANLARGVKEADAANGGISRDQAAAALAVDPAGVERARTVVSRGAPELQQAVDEGKVTVRAAADLATLPVAQQAEIIRGADRKALSRVIKEMRAERQADKKKRRTERERELGAKIAALPAKKYGVIVADPEWEFEVWSEETGKDRSPDNHYPTSPTDIIAARPVADIAADDCLLLLWATAPRLLDAIAVMQAWGFTYQTHAIGRKPQIITGYWFRNRHELLLLGTRGTVPCPAMGTQPESIFDMAVEDPEHSKKPDFAHVYAEMFFPSVPKIELNARRARPGWDVWGLEAPETGASNEDGNLIDREMPASDAIGAQALAAENEEPTLTGDIPGSVVSDGGSRTSEESGVTLVEAVSEQMASPPLRADDVRAEADEPILAQDHVAVTRDIHPFLHRAFETISHDSGAGAGHDSYPVPAHWRLCLPAIEAALARLDPDELEVFCIGDDGERDALKANPDYACPALGWAHDLLNEFFEGFPGDVAPPDPAAPEEAPQFAPIEGKCCERHTSTDDVPYFLRRRA